MTSALQNRLVGTMIVVALVVIFVPEFLDGEKRTNDHAFVDVPPVAELVTVESIEPFDTSEVESELNRAVEIVDEVAIDAPTDSAPSTTVAKQTPDTDVTEPQTVNTSPPPAIEEMPAIDIKDSGWVVQLGSFRNQKSVRELIKKLNNAGYRAYTRPIMTPMGELNKVFVGPELNKEKLQKALPHLKELTDLKGKITAFEVSAG